MRNQVLALSLALSISPAAHAQQARGIVYHDANNNSIKDPGEKPLPKIRISNGRDIVLTNEDGQYEIPVDNDDIIFIIKPKGWTTPLSDNNLPRFYYIHKPEGSPKLRYPGVAPTGPLPDSINFPLTKQTEPNRFSAIFFGDTQSRNVQEVNYLAHDIVEDLIGTDAAFGVTLGDIVFDNLNILQPHNQTIALIGIPWYNVLGNHDINYDVPNDELSDETFERIYGPPTYSFDYGPVHYIAIDNVFYFRNAENKGQYRGSITEDQMNFIIKDLALLDPDQLVVLMMHIPLFNVPERTQLFEALANHPNNFSISGHTHWQEHFFLDSQNGNNAKPHHHLVNVTACGSWWTGEPDERGIPHATMADGAPNGHSIITFTNNTYKVTYKPASLPADYQMAIHAPEMVSPGEEPQIIVNVFAGSPRSTVQMRIDDDSTWIDLTREKRQDPAFAAMKRLEESAPTPRGRKLPNPSNTGHIWVTNLPPNLPSGSHLIQIRTTDMFGQQYTASRTIRIR